MANTDIQPWAPDPDNKPGKPPVGGTGGERGTSVFPGTANWTTDGFRVNGYMGPGTGVSYHAGEGGVALDSAAHTGTSVRSSAGTHAPQAVTSIVVTPSNATPAANASVDLTATITFPEEWPLTGTVVFKDGATTLHTSTISDATSPSVTTWTDSAGFAAGAHSITAVYSGDSNYATITSAAVTITAS